jgi:hypothetical protein
MVNQLEPSAVVSHLIASAHYRPVQPIATSELMIALAVIGLVGLIFTAGFVLGRRHHVHQRRGLIKKRPIKRHLDRHDPDGERRNLKLVTPKRR